MSNVIQLSNTQRGFTRMDNELYEALIASNLSRIELRVAMALHRLTAGYNREFVKVAALYISKMLYGDESKADAERANVSRAINSLIRQRVIYRSGGSRDPISFMPPNEWKVACKSTVLKSTHCVENTPASVCEITHIKERNTNPLNLPTVDTVPHSAIENQVNVIFANGEFTISPDLISRWGETFTGLDVDGEIQAAASWVADNPKKAKKDWQRFLSSWLRRAHKDLKRVDEGSVPVDKIIDLYHKTCPNFPAVSVRSDAALRSMIVERWNEATEQQSGQGFWHPFFMKAARRNQVFYRGQNILPRLEAILSRANFRDIVEAQA